MSKGTGDKKKQMRSESGSVGMGGTVLAQKHEGPKKNKSEKEMNKTQTNETYSYFLFAILYIEGPMQHEYLCYVCTVRLLLIHELQQQ